jgi:hypothetical protein
VQPPRVAPRPTVNLVHVVEESPPEGESPVEWLLYTTEYVQTAEQIADIVDGYRARWTIEELNAALETGCAYESRQFGSRHALLNILAFTLPVHASCSRSAVVLETVPTLRPRVIQPVIAVSALYQQTKRPPRDARRRRRAPGEAKLIWSACLPGVFGALAV